MSCSALILGDKYEQFPQCQRIRHNSGGELGAGEPSPSSFFFWKIWVSGIEYTIAEWFSRMEFIICLFVRWWLNIQQVFCRPRWPIMGDQDTASSDNRHLGPQIYYAQNAWHHCGREPVSHLVSQSTVPLGRLTVFQTHTTWTVPYLPAKITVNPGWLLEFRIQVWPPKRRDMWKHFWS